MVNNRFPVDRARMSMLATLGCVLVALLCAAPVFALVMDLSTTELTDMSATVVIARAVSSESRWTDSSGATIFDKGTIVTDVRLAVFEVLKGQAPATMTITVPGGSVGDVSIPVTDAPRFAPGSTYVVFLAANGQVVAWREGQPQVVGAQVPELQASLAEVKATVAQRTGREAEVVRPWSGRAAEGAVAAPLPAMVVDETGAAPQALPLGTGVTSTALPGGVALDGSAAEGVVVNGPAATGAATAQAPAAGSPSAQPRAVTTLFQDDFESMSMSQWNLLYSTPVHLNQGYFSNDYWVDDADNVYWWAYSAAQQAYMYIDPQWFWEHQFAYGGSYANNDTTWMITKNPVNLSSYPYAVLDFDLWLDTADAYDQLGVWFSTDGSNFSGPYWYEQEGSLADPPAFAAKSIDLRNVPVPGGTQNFCGQSQVWVAFHFQSNGSGVAMGGCVDNVRLRGSTTPIPVIGSIDPPSAPSGTYLKPTRNQSRVTITGSGFGGTRGSVKFFYQSGEPLISAPIVSWSGTQIVCDVPIGVINNYAASAGSGPVRVTTAAGATSGGYSFDVPFAYGNQDFEASRCLYRVNMDGPQQAAVDAAAQSWNGVGTQMQFQNIGPCATTAVGTGSSTHMPRDGHNDMCFDSLPFPGVIAAAWPLAVGGRMLETDICFNTTGGFSWGDAAWDSGVMDIQTIAAHEIGHWLNMRDLYGPGDTGRVMYGFCGLGIVKRSLTAGEVSGIEWIYDGHGLDTAGPVGQAKSLTVTRGRTAKVRFCVNDPKPSIGVSSARVQIKNRSGKVVKTLNKSWVYTRLWYTWSFRCSLARGRYSIVVTGADLLGQPSTKSVKGYLTVK